MADGKGTTLDDLIEDVNFSMGTGPSDRDQALLEDLERRKRARTMAVPTDDGRVRARLREIGEPITLFGERPPDRRDRLKYVLSQIQEAKGGEGLIDESSDEESEEEEEEFYTPGTTELLDARRHIAEFSLPRARARLNHQRVESKLPLSRIIDLKKSVIASLKKFSQLGTQIGDERPISQVRFSPNGQLMATGSWSGNVKLWDMPSCNPKHQLRGHTDRIGGIAWHPGATLSQGPDLLNLVSGGADYNVNLWSLTSETPLATLKGHRDRVVRVAMHPSGSYAASASFDGTWRLWDVRAQASVSTHVASSKKSSSLASAELLMQEGHSKEVYVVQFQDDGALVGSAGLDGIGRVWDLRTGRTAMVLDGHAQAIFSMDFSPNGHQLATGSQDNTVRIWDMRSLKALYTIPAHKSNVSEVRFFRREHAIRSPRNTKTADSMDVDVSNDKPEDEGDDERYTDGLWLITGGYDGLVKIWSADDWQLVKTMATDAGKVMSVDISPGGEFIASGSWNRSFQLFTRED